jgi:hypothetical protein
VLRREYEADTLRGNLGLPTPKNRHTAARREPERARADQLDSPRPIDCLTDRYGATVSGWDDAEVERAPICPCCGVTALPRDPANVIDSVFICENPDCDAYGEPL